MGTATAAPDGFEVRTRDRAIITAALNRLAAHRARVTFDDPAKVDMHVRSTRWDALGGVRLRLGGVGYAVSAEPIDFVFGGFVADGAATVRFRDQEIQLGRGDGWMFPLGVAYGGEYGNTTFGVVSLPLADAAELFESTTGLPAADLRFEAPTPVSTAMRRYWAATADFLSRQLTAPEADLPPLVVGELTRLAASAVLAVFPNTAMTAAHRPADGRVAPAVVRRAVAFMDAHPDRPITVATVAAAAGVGARGLQVAFRRHLGTTPMAYLRRVRLERVHRELLCAPPGDGTTVTGVARRWGFTNPSRFAAEYRAAFGQLPSRTLRT